MEIVSFNKYAGFFKRFIAFVIDYIVIRLVLRLLFVRFVLGIALGDYDMFEWRHLFHWYTLVIELITMAYFVVCETSSWQGTVGKKLLGMKVVNARTFGRINTGDAVMRFLSKYISSAVFLLGFIWIIFDDRKQGWHDKLADTVVIEK